MNPTTHCFWVTWAMTEWDSFMKMTGCDYTTSVTVDDSDTDTLCSIAN
jgi:hypothetical protein